MIPVADKRFLCAAASEAAAAAAADVERQQNGGGAVELDEFGRDVRVEAGREATLRQQRLEKRMQRWQVALSISSVLTCLRGV